MSALIEDLPDLPPRTAEVSCGDRTHRLTWVQGAIRVEDHDMEAEATLGSLGALPSYCGEVARAWPWTALGLERVLDELAGWARRSLDPMTRRDMEEKLRRYEQQMPAQARERMLGYLREALELELEWWLLRSLPAALKDMLCVEVLAAAEDRWVGDDDFRDFARPRVEAVVASLVQPCVHGCLEAFGRRLGPRTKISSWVVEPGEDPSCEGWPVSAGAGVVVRLGFDWPVRVWARRLAVVDGCLVLDAVGRGSDRVGVVAARWERTSRGLLPVVGNAVAVRAGDGWALRWV
ncbi:MAG TPA: hypothetical protein VM840_07015 [Actinomycetota bacterium]|nr:hypothetical protein [Actinomycetota bacterium]